MPLILQKQLSEDDILGVWKIEENINEMLLYIKNYANELQVQSLLSHIEKFAYEHRKSEWLGARLLLCNLLQEYKEISYSQSGQPRIPNSEFNISISHSKNMVTVLLSRDKQAGIDVEYISDRIFNIIPKFLSEEEIKQLNITDRLQLITCWCAKEAIYKLTGKQGLSFIHNIRICLDENMHEFETQLITGRSTERLLLKRLLINNYVIVYTTY